MTHSIGWLHLSDIHFLTHSQWNDEPKVVMLIEDIRKQIESGRVVDFIICTGDVGYGEKAGEVLTFQYQDAEKFFTKVLKVCNLSKDRLFIVPGNHDTSRKQANSKALVEFFRSPKRELSEINQMLIDRDGDCIRAMERLSEYKDFIGKQCPHISLNEDVSFSKILEIKGCNIVLSGLNSSWTCVDDKDKNQLWLGGQAQLHKHSQYLQSYSKEKWGEIEFVPDLRLVLMHHPLGWLNPAEEKILRPIFENSFDIFLHGHEHDAWLKPGSPKQNGLSQHYTLSAGAAIAGNESEIGYNFTEIDMNSGKMYLRAYDERGAGWIKRAIADRAEDGIWEFAVPQGIRNWVARCKKELDLESKIAVELIDKIPVADDVKISNEIYNEYDSYRVPSLVTKPSFFPEEFGDAACNEEKLARLIFGNFSYEKRWANSSSKGYYFRRKLDSQLDDLLSKHKWILIEGHPLAGKTRAVFEAFKHLFSQEPKAVIWPFKTLSARQDFQVPNFPVAASLKIVFIDDIDQTLINLKGTGHNVAAINLYLRNLAESGFILVATARTGPKNCEFQQRFGLDDRIWDKFENVLIPKLSDVEGAYFSDWYQECFGAKLPDKFDHQPGSLFLDLNAMHDRWTQMEDLAQDGNVKFDVNYAKKILLAMHTFYVMQAWRTGGLFSEENLRFYFEHLEKNSSKKGNAMTRALRGLTPRGIIADWDLIVGFLAQDRYHLGFLQRVRLDDGYYLQIETAYLDYIVAEYAGGNIPMDVWDNFGPAERQRLGFLITPFDFGSVLQGRKISAEDELRRLIRNLKHLGMLHKVVAWNQIIDHCTSLHLARIAIQEMHKNNVEANVVTWNGMLNKPSTVKEIKGIFRKMIDDQIKPDIVTWNCLLTRVEKFSDCETEFIQMKKDGINPDLVSWNAVLTKVSDFTLCEDVMEKMRAAGVVPDIVSWNAVLVRAPRFEDAYKVVVQIRKDKIEPDIFTWTTFLSKTVTAFDKEVVYSCMRDAGHNPDWLL